MGAGVPFASKGPLAAENACKGPLPARGSQPRAPWVRPDGSGIAGRSAWWSVTSRVVGVLVAGERTTRT